MRNSMTQFTYLECDCELPQHSLRCYVDNDYDDETPSVYFETKLNPVRGLRRRLGQVVRYLAGRDAHLYEETLVSGERASRLRHLLDVVMPPEPTGFYIVEFWSKQAILTDSDGRKQHEVGHAYAASTKEKAISWCLQNLDYGGSEGVHFGYFPWEFRIVAITLDEDAWDNKQIVKVIDPLVNV